MSDYSAVFHFAIVANSPVCIRSDALPRKVHFHDPTGEPVPLDAADENAPRLVAAGRSCLRGGVYRSGLAGGLWGMWGRE